MRTFLLALALSLDLSAGAALAGGGDEAAQDRAEPEGLSAEGRRAFDRVRPVAVARSFIRQGQGGPTGFDGSGHDLDGGSAAAYCPPQPTEYGWLVTFPSRTGGEPLLVAVTNEKTAWRLHPKTLERIEPAAKDARPTPFAPSVAEAPAGQVGLDLAGEWRVLLPAGFEYPVTLLDVDETGYTLQPAGLTFGGSYRVERDRLVSVGQVPAERGRYVWKIRSPYMLTLVEQPTGMTSDYRGAVLFRPTIQLDREAKPAGAPAKPGQVRKGRRGVPQVTVEELAAAIRSEGFQWRFIGREIEFTATGLTGNRVRIEGMDTDLLDTAVLHHGPGGEDRMRNLGPRFRVRGLIVDQCYGVWQIWPYSITAVKD